jgi:integration host factor subunit beta
MEGLTVWNALEQTAGARPFDFEFRWSLTAMNDATTMTKADLVEQVIQATALPRKESETIVETIFESIIQALQTGDKIEIRGFGSFRTRQRRGRIGRNPKTGAKVDVPPKRIPFFKPSKELKDFVNGQLSPAAASGTPQASSQGPS